jgi:colanic acid biosynthesis protein WcaH
MKIAAALATLRSAISLPGLPEEIFLFVSSITPLVNVDLLIRDGAGRTLLTWRDDAFYGPGWHVPGGIIRFKERAAARIKAVAANELGATVAFDPTPLATHEIIHATRAQRGHFISSLYACTLTSAPDEARRAQLPSPRHGEWAWHPGCPAELIAVHEIYRTAIDGGR